MSLLLLVIHSHRLILELLAIPHLHQVGIVVLVRALKNLLLLEILKLGDEVKGLGCIVEVVPVSVSVFMLLRHSLKSL